MGRNIRVLHVDDEPGMLEIGRIFLEEGSGFAVDTSSSAGAALEQLKRKHYDAIVSDYQMPEMDGITFLRQLKLSGNATPFIIFTGKGREEVVIEALNEGADFYLQKGGDPRAQFTELANKIQYAVKRRRAEEGLRESEERYRHVVEDQTEFICRFLPDGTHIFVNDAYCRYFGLEREEILGSRFRPTIHPEDRPDVARILASLSPDHPLDTIDQRILMPDGSIRWQRWVDRAIFHADGSLKEYQSVGRDITDYKRSEDALRESEKKYRTVFETTGTAMVLIENDATISLANTEFERLSGFSKEEIEKKKKWTEFVVKEDLDRMLAQHNMRRKDRASALTQYEFRFKTRTGEIRNIFLTIDIIPDTSQSVASLLDVTDRKVVEEIRRERLMTERALINSPAEVAVLLDNHGIILNINDQYANMLGTSPQDLLGACLWDLTPPEVKDSRRNIVDQAIREKEVIRFEECSKNQWSDILVNPILSPEGTVVSVAVIARDITEQKVAERELRANEELFRKVLENANDAIFLLERTPEGPGRYLLVNEEAVRMLGYTREEFQQMTPRDIVPEEVRERVMPAVMQKLKKDGHATFESVHRRKDGSCYPVEVSTHTFRSRGIDVDLSITRDISCRKRAEQMLLESEAEFRAFFNNVGDAIAIHDMQGRFLEVNDEICRRLGYLREELLAMNAGRIDHPEYGRLVPVRIRELQQAGQIVFETVHLAKDGSCIPVEVSSRLISFNGQPAVISTARDTTERKRTEKALQQSGRKLNLLTRITRHDIRNQIVVLDGYVDLLDSEIGDKAYEQYFSRIRAASSQIGSMIRFTQEYEKIGINVPVWQDPHILVGDAGRSAALGHITLENDLPSGTQVFADPLIEKVFFNLIENAVRHGGTVTKIRFSFETRSEEGIIVCEDDGAGIPPEKKEKIFERGFGRNTGLGLALSREILDITGITLTETGDPGRGARFEMRIPKGMHRRGSCLSGGPPN